jgi:hypothetical protein
MGTPASIVVGPGRTDKAREMAAGGIPSTVHDDRVMKTSRGVDDDCGGIIGVEGISHDASISQYDQRNRGVNSAFRGMPPPSQAWPIDGKSILPFEMRCCQCVRDAPPGVSSFGSAVQRDKGDVTTVHHPTTTTNATGGLILPSDGDGAAVASVVPNGGVPTAQSPPGGGGGWGGGPSSEHRLTTPPRVLLPSPGCVALRGIKYKKRIVAVTMSRMAQGARTMWHTATAGRDDDNVYDIVEANE